MAYYPIAMDLTDKTCLIVGGGEVAFRKAVSLREAGARVTIISPEADPRLASLDGVEIIGRAFQPGDTAEHTLVFAATDDQSINSAVSREAVQHGIPVNVVDDPDLCSFIVPACVRRGDLLLAVSTSGKSPALSKRIRIELESRYGPEYADFVNLLGELRDEVKAKYPSQADREEVFNRLVDSGILQLFRQGKKNEAQKKARKLI